VPVTHNPIVATRKAPFLEKTHDTIAGFFLLACDSKKWVSHGFGQEVWLSIFVGS
jgi:hypothetical protein